MRGTLWVRCYWVSYFWCVVEGRVRFGVNSRIAVRLDEPQLLEYIERREVALGKYRASLPDAARTFANPQKDYDDYLNN